MPEFNEDYKAKLLIWHHKTLANNLQRHDQDKLFTVFREIVTWCIKGVINKLKKVLDSKNDSIYKDIIFSTLKDVNSGFNSIDPTEFGNSSFTILSYTQFLLI